MNELVTFDFDGKEVRTLTIDGITWFVGKDVCQCLGLVDHRKAIQELDEDEKGEGSILTLGGRQQMVCVNEMGLYSLILRSRKPAAKRLKRFVTHEVLPTLRKTGRYDPNPPRMPPRDAHRAVLSRISMQNQAIRLMEKLNVVAGEAQKQSMYCMLEGLCVEIGIDAPPLDAFAQAAPFAPPADMDGFLKPGEPEIEHAHLLQAFLAENCVADPSARVQSSMLYKAFTRWCEATGEPAGLISNKRFASIMRQAGWRKKQSNYIYFLGLRLKAEAVRALR